MPRRAVVAIASAVYPSALIVCYAAHVPEVRILHNPRCSKSRQTLALLKERFDEAQLEVVEYLRTPLSESELRALAKKLRLAPKDFVRTKEAEFEELGLASQLADDDAMFRALAKTPKLLERPIVIVGKQAAIGRPPGNVLSILPS